MSKFGLNGTPQERRYVGKLKAAIRAYDKHFGNDDPDDPNDNGESIIAAWVKRRLSPEEFNQLMPALTACGEGNRDRVMELLSEGGGDDEPDRDREDELESRWLDTPGQDQRRRARDMRSGILPSVRAAMDAAPKPISRSAAESFKRLFPSSVRPGQL